MRADIHDGREHMLQSEAGYIDARPHLPELTKPLAPHGRTMHGSHWVTRRHSREERCALPGGRHTSAAAICRERAVSQWDRSPINRLSSRSSPDSPGQRRLVIAAVDALLLDQP